MQNLKWYAVLIALLLVTGVARAEESSLTVTAATMTLRSASDGSLQGGCEYQFVAIGATQSRAVAMTGHAQIVQVDAPENLSILPGTNRLVAMAQQAGRYTASVKLMVPTKLGMGGRHVTLPVPQAAQRRIEITFPDARVTVRGPKGTIVQMRYDAAGSVATVLPAAGDQKVVLWVQNDTRRTDGAQEIAVRVAGRVEVSDDKYRIVAEYHCTPLSGEMERVPFSIPKGWQVIDCSGSGMTGWRPDTENPNQIVVSRRDDGTPFTVRLVCDRFPEKDEASLALSLPMPTTAVRAEGVMGVHARGQQIVRVTGIAGGQQADQGFRIERADVVATLAIERRLFRFTAALRERIALKTHGLQIDGELTIKPVSGSAFRVRCRASKNLRVVNVKNVERWEQQGDLIVIEMREPITAETKFSFTAEVNRAENEWRQPLLLPEGALGTDVLFSYDPQEGFDLVRQGKANGLFQMDTSRIPQWMTPATSAYRGDRPPEGMQIALRRVPTMVRARTMSLVDVQGQRLDLSCYIGVRVRRSSVFQHRLLLGPNLEIDSLTGPEIRDWEYDATSGALLVRLSQALRTESMMTLRAHRILPDDSTDFKLPLPVYEDATSFRGALLLSPMRGWNVETILGAGVGDATPEEMILFEENDAATRAFHKDRFPVKSASGRGGKFGSRTGRIRGPVKPLQRKAKLGERFFTFQAEARELTVVRKQQQAVLWANETIDVRARRGLVQLVTEFDFKLEKGGLTRLRIRVPEGFRNVSLTPILSTPAMRNRSRSAENVALFRADDIPPPDADGVITIDFPQPVFSLPSIRLTCDRPLVEGETLTLAPLQVFEAFHTAGTFDLRKHTDGQGGSRINLMIAEADQAGVVQAFDTAKPADPHAQAAWGLLVGRYRFDTLGAKLPFSIDAVESEGRRPAVATNCKLTSRLADDGSLITRLRCDVENPDAQQYLDVTLPIGAEIWSTFVESKGSAAKPIKPMHDPKSGRLLVPLIGDNIDGTRFQLEVVYAQQTTPPLLGYVDLGMQTPQLTDTAQGSTSAMQIEKLSWDLYLPDSYDMVGHGGNLQLASGEQSLTSRLLHLIGALLSALWFLLTLVLQWIFMGLLWLIKWAFLLALVVVPIYLIGRSLRRHPRGASSLLAKAAVAICLFIVIIMLMSGPLMQSKKMADVTADASNLRQIGLAIVQFESQNGRRPVDLQTLVNKGYIEDPAMFTSRLGGEVFYVGAEKSVNAEQDPDQEILAVMTFGEGGDDRSNVLFRDGHVKTMDNDRIADNMRVYGNFDALQGVSQRWAYNRQAQQGQEGLFAQTDASKRNDRGGKSSYWSLRSSETFSDSGAVMPNDELSSGYSYNVEEARQKNREAERQAQERSRQQQLTMNHAARVGNRRGKSGFIDQLGEFNTNVQGQLHDAPQTQSNENAMLAQVPLDDSQAAGEVMEELLPQRRDATTSMRPPESTIEGADQEYAPPTSRLDEKEESARRPVQKPNAPALATDEGESLKDKRRKRLEELGYGLEESPLEDSEMSLPVDPFVTAVVDVEVDVVPTPDAARVEGDPSEFSELDEDVHSPGFMGIGAIGGAGGRESNARSSAKRKVQLAKEPKSVDKLDGDDGLFSSGKLGPAQGGQGQGRRLSRISDGRQSGAMPIRVDFDTLDGGSRKFTFVRDTASSASGRVEVRCLTAGTSLALECLTALLIVIGMLRLYERRFVIAIVANGALLLVVLLAWSWMQAAFAPHMVVALTALGAMLALQAVKRGLRRFVQRPTIA